MKNIEKIIGWILLILPLFSIILFFAQLVCETNLTQNLSLTIWTGSYVGLREEHATSNGFGTFTSNTPLYFGLMAIAGAYLIKKTNKE